jgi:hypothetical protein
VLREGSRQVKEVAWSLGSLQAGQTSLSVGGVAVDGCSIMSGMHGGMQLFSGRPGTQSVEDLGDRLEAAYAKGRSKDKKLTRAEFLHQLAGYLECEALRVWRKHRGDILKPREAAAGVEWDPIEEVVKLFKKEFGAASAEQVQELQNLTRREGETCRMLKARLEQLSEETGLLNKQERAIAFVGALPDALRSQVEPLVWSQSEGGVYSLEKAFQVAERMDLAKAFAMGRRRGDEQHLEVVAAATGAGITTYGADRTPPACYRCGQHGHKADTCALPRTVVCGTCSKEGHAAAACWQKMGKPEWANHMAQPGLRRVAELEAQVKELTGKLAAVHASFASMVGEPSREDSY